MSDKSYSLCPLTLLDTPTPQVLCPVGPAGTNYYASNFNLPGRNTNDLYFILTMKIK